jgi:hypothetical protein
MLSFEHRHRMIQNKINSLVSAGDGKFTWDEGTQSLTYKGLLIDAFPTDFWVDSLRYLDFFEDGSTEPVDINDVKVKALYRGQSPNGFNRLPRYYFSGRSMRPWISGFTRRRLGERDCARGLEHVFGDVGRMSERDEAPILQVGKFINLFISGRPIDHDFQWRCVFLGSY